MMPASALILALADASAFAPPPNRPSRPERRTEGTGGIRTLVRTFRSELTRVLSDPTEPGIPRVSATYPY